MQGSSEVKNFDGIREADIKSKQPQGNKRKEKGLGFVCFASFIAFGASKFLSNRFSWLPKDPKIQALFGLISLGTGIIGLKTYRDRKNAEQELTKEREDAFLPIEPKEVLNLWRNPFIKPIIQKQISKLNFAQLQTIWPDLADNERKQLNESLKRGRAYTLSQIMEMLESCKTLTVNDRVLTYDEIKQFLLEDDFITCMKTFPGLFEAFGEVLIPHQSKESDYIGLVFQMNLKKFNLKSDLSKFGKEARISIIIRKNNEEEQIDNIDPEILETATEKKFRFGKPTDGKIVINLTQNSEEIPQDDLEKITPKDIKKMIYDYATAQEPSLHWLIDNYHMINLYDFEPLLYRMHALIFQKCDELPRYTTYTQNEIAYMFAQAPPKNIKKAKSTWEDADVKKTNLLLAMSYATFFQLDKVKEKCGKMIRHITDAKLFGQAFDHATRLNDQVLVSTCIDTVAKNTNSSLHTTWEDLFEMSDTLIELISERTKLSPNELQVLLKRMGPFEGSQYNKGFTIQQLMNTIGKMKTENPNMIIGLIKTKGFITLIKKNPGLFAPIRDVLLERNKETFQLEVFRLYAKAFYPPSISISDSEDRLTFYVKKGDETLEMPNMPRAVLDCAGEMFENLDTIQLGLNDSFTFLQLKEIFETLMDSKEPSLDWLIERYEVLNALKFAPFLYRFHTLLTEGMDKDDLFKVHSRKKIGELFITQPPYKVDSLGEAWKKIAITEKTVFIAMTLANRLKMDQLRKNCRKFLEDFTKKEESSSVEKLNDPVLFREIYEHAQKLSDQDFLQFLEDIAIHRKRHSSLITTAWNPLGMPKGLHMAITTYKDPRDQFEVRKDFTLI